jgi:hypothetical protein
VRNFQKILNFLILGNFKNIGKNSGKFLEIVVYSVEGGKFWK